jgi:hypothetical protein
MTFYYVLASTYFFTRTLGASGHISNNLSEGFFKKFTNDNKLSLAAYIRTEPIKSLYTLCDIERSNYSLFLARNTAWILCFCV